MGSVSRPVKWAPPVIGGSARPTKPAAGVMIPKASPRLWMSKWSVNGILQSKRRRVRHRREAAQWGIDNRAIVYYTDLVRLFKVQKDARIKPGDMGIVLADKMIHAFFDFARNELMHIPGAQPTA